jgi:hypothetical protein
MTLYTNLLNASASHRLEAFFGIGPGLQQRVAAIAILSAMIERQVELALWTLESERFRPGLNESPRCCGPQQLLRTNTGSTLTSLN